MALLATAEADHVVGARFRCVWEARAFCLEAVVRRPLPLPLPLGRRGGGWPLPEGLPFRERPLPFPLSRRSSLPFSRGW